jgi:magnesium chelatase accessory protein
MAQDLAALLAHLHLNPAALVGHSAGAAIALRLVELGAAPAARVIAINPALAPFQGLAGWLFPVMARALALTPFAARLFAATTTPASVDRLLRGTGSVIGPEGAALYLRLARDPAHVDATLSMMAQWDLTGLLGRMARITAPVLLIAGLRDTAVPPSVALDAARILPRARLVTLPDLGHLAHEEDPATIAALIRDDLAREPAPDTAPAPPPA